MGGRRGGGSMWEEGWWEGGRMVKETGFNGLGTFARLRSE